MRRRGEPLKRSEGSHARASKDLCFERFLGSGVSGRQNMLLIVPLFLMRWATAIIPFKLHNYTIITSDDITRRTTTQQPCHLYSNFFSACC